MKHKGKKIFAMFLVLAMLFSMSSVSFADTVDTTTGYNLTGFGNKVGSITVTGHRYRRDCCGAFTYS